LRYLSPYQIGLEPNIYRGHRTDTMGQPGALYPAHPSDCMVDLWRSRPRRESSNPKAPTGWPPGTPYNPKATVNYLKREATPTTSATARIQAPHSAAKETPPTTVDRPPRSDARPQAATTTMMSAPPPPVPPAAFETMTKRVNLLVTENHRSTPHAS